ncbi:MAG: hypothetical protein ACRC9H_15545, partial [Aeromonas veronii]
SPTPTGLGQFALAAPGALQYTQQLYGMPVPAPINNSTAPLQTSFMNDVPTFGGQTPNPTAPSLLVNNPPTSSWSSMFAPDFFKGVGDTTVTSNIGSRPSVFSNNQQTGTTGTSGITSQTTQQVRRPVATDTAVVQQQQPPATVDTQPTTSQPISPIGLQGVTNAMNAKSTAGNPIPDATNTDMSLWGKVKQGVGEVFGISPDQQYLKNQDGSLMVDDNGNNIIDPNQRTWTDIGAVAGGLANTAMAAYGMFTGFDQGQQQLDTQRGQLNLMREKYAEDKRKNQAIVAQNRGA